MIAILTFFRGTNPRRAVLGMASVAVLAASGYKATQYAQTAWGSWEGTALIIGAAIAAFFALHTAFDEKAGKLTWRFWKSARFWAGFAALAISGLEGAAIMQGNLDKLITETQKKHEKKVLAWENKKAEVDTEYQSLLQRWETEKETAETTLGVTNKPLYEDMDSIKLALAENAASQRTTKASDKDGNVTPAYQALLDQQATLLERSAAITKQLSMPIQLEAKPLKAAYPVEPVMPEVTLTPVEYGQAFAFPALAFVIMFLLGRRDEENHGLASLDEIRQQASRIISALHGNLGSAEAQSEILLERIKQCGNEESGRAHARMEQFNQESATHIELAGQRLKDLLSAVNAATTDGLAHIRSASKAETAALQNLLRQIQQMASASIREAENSVESVASKAATEASEGIKSLLTDLLEEAGSVSEELQKQVIKCNALLAKSNVPAMYRRGQVHCTEESNQLEENTGIRKKLTRNEVLNLLRVQAIELDENGLITRAMIEENAGVGRKLAEKYRDKAIQYGYLLASPHAGGVCCTYPDDIQPDRHSERQLPEQSHADVADMAFAMKNIRNIVVPIKPSSNQLWSA